MGRIRGLAKRALNRLARAVAQDELFERPGEAGPPPPPLARVGEAPAPAPPPAQPVAPERRPAAAPTPQASPPGSPLALPFDRPAGAVRADLAAVQALLAPGGGLRLVAHWATWCISCVEELPLLREVDAEWGEQLTVFGLSWDLFDPRGDEDDIVAHVEQFAGGHGLRWPSAVVAAEVSAEAFFDALHVTFDKVPQTWLVNDAGVVLHRVEGAIDAGNVAALNAAIRAAIAAQA